MGNFRGRKLSRYFTVLWLFAQVFSAKFGGVASFGAAQRAIHESFLCENRIFHQFAKVFFLKSFLLYSRPKKFVFVHQTTSHCFGLRLTDNMCNWHLQLAQLTLRIALFKQKRCTLKLTGFSEPGGFHGRVTGLRHFILK